jgi:hypothetical protein
MEQAVRTADRQPRRLDVAASAATVRREAEDERRSREQFVRVIYTNLVEATN